MYYHPDSMTALRRSSSWLLVIGLLAVMMHAYADLGVMAKRGADGGFVAELCTSQGMVKPGAALPGSDEQALHNCCQLCTGGGPLLLTALSLAVPPAPTFPTANAALPSAAPRQAPWHAHPPRGPPSLV